MDFTLVRPRMTPLVRKLLWADAAVEAAIALVLLGIVGRPHWWLNVEREVTVLGAAVFAVAAIAIAVAAWHRRTSAQFVEYLAFANIAGGVAVWIAAIARWSDFEPEGRWLIAAGADAFLLLGVLELVALRKRAEE